MTPIHIMLDLETWGTRPGCDIRSIGACLFVPHTGAVCTPDHIQTQPDYPHGTFYIACDNPIVEPEDYPSTVPLFDDGTGTGTCRKYPLHRDTRTVQWWSEAAQAAFADPVDLGVALIAFADWVVALHGDGTVHYSAGYNAAFVPSAADIRLWSHGPAFDPPILAEAYHAVGWPVPWHYRAPRDTRTAFDMAGITDHSAWLAQHPGPLGVSHHSLDDSICQARAVCAAWSRINIASSSNSV